MDQEPSLGRKILAVLNNKVGQGQEDSATAKLPVHPNCTDGYQLIPCPATLSCALSPANPNGTCVHAFRIYSMYTVLQPLERSIDHPFLLHPIYPRHTWCRDRILIPPSVSNLTSVAYIFKDFIYSAMHMHVCPLVSRFFL